MNAGTWTLSKEKLVDGWRVRLYRQTFCTAGEPELFRRVLERSRAGLKAGAWCAVEICERAPDGTLSPWRPEPWEHRKE